MCNINAFIIAPLLFGCLYFVLILLLAIALPRAPEQNVAENQHSFIKTIARFIAYLAAALIVFWVSYEWFISKDQFSFKANFVVAAIFIPSLSMLISATLKNQKIRPYTKAIERLLIYWHLAIIVFILLAWLWLSFCFTFTKLC